MEGPEGLFEPVFITDEMASVTSARNWVQKMVEFESALAVSLSQVGLIPREAAEEISRLSSNHNVTPTELGISARASATPVIQLVRRLASQLSDEASPWIHFGATSQDVLDSATMMVVRDAIRLLFGRLVEAGELLVSLADDHRQTLSVARTLMQHALPTTFGLKAANWLEGVAAATDDLARFYSTDIALQFGGAAGTLAAFGDRGVEVGSNMASILGLAFPAMPWHSQRVRIARLGTSLSILVGTLAKMGTDIVLASQLEISELSLTRAGGGSSALPQKVNPVGPILMNACFRRVEGLVPILVGSLLAENERGAGEWPAEWESVRDILNLADASAENAVETLNSLVVHEDAMLRNLSLSNGNVMSERVSLVMGEFLGRTLAQDLVRAAALNCAENGTSLQDELMKMEEFREHFSDRDIAEMFDPMRYLGSAQEFIDRAITHWRSSLDNWKMIFEVGIDG